MHNWLTMLKHCKCKCVNRLRSACMVGCHVKVLQFISRGIKPREKPRQNELLHDFLRLPVAEIRIFGPKSATRTSFRHLAAKL